MALSEDKQMTKLQTALVWWDTEGSFHHGVGPIVEMVEAARLVANAKQFIRPHQSELNRELRAALGRGRLAPWERDIEALLNIADALTPPGDTDTHA